MGCEGRNEPRQTICQLYSLQPLMCVHSRGPCMFEAFCRGKVPLLSLLLQSLDQSVIIEVHYIVLL